MEAMVDVGELLDGSEPTDDVFYEIDAVGFEIAEKEEKLEPILGVYDAHVSVLPLHFDAVLPFLDFGVGLFGEDVHWRRDRLEAQ